MKDKEILRRYWLNLATAEQKEQIELRFIKDVVFCDLAESVEDVLINDYARNRLTSEERQQFEEIFLKDPVRQKKVASLQPQDREWEAGIIPKLRDLFQLPAIGGGWRSAAAVMVIVIALGGSLLLFNYLKDNRKSRGVDDLSNVGSPTPIVIPTASVADTTQPTITPGKSLPAPTPKLKERKNEMPPQAGQEDTIAVIQDVGDFELSLETRGTEPDPKILRIDPAAGKVRFTFSLDTGECSRCRVTVFKREGSSKPELIFARNLSHSMRAGGRVVVLEIPADKLSSGLYRILLEDIRINDRKESRVCRFRVEAASLKEE
jgi:hypothetical protein